MSPKIKTILINLAKVGFAAGILIWMYQTGKLDFARLSFFYEQPLMVAIPVLGWVAAMMIASVRWQLLLRGVGLATPFKRVLQLTWIGLFFNTTMPGSVGGDLVKAVYVMRDHQQDRTRATLTILLDRILGLMGLFALGGTLAMFNLGEFLGNPALSTIMIIVLGVCLGIVGFFVLVFRKSSRSAQETPAILNAAIPGMGLIRKIYQALRVYKQEPLLLLQCFFLSVVVQSIVLSVMMLLTFLINGEPPPVARLIPVLPVAILLTALPLAPAGLGVGHVAFAQVFEFAGVANGANVFNAYILITLVMNLSGIVPYLMFRKKEEGISMVANAERHS